ncbi:hypothetical protein IMAU10237_02919 [Lactiplantibacillus plantarum]|nr:hypothetical protein [Lactiplantibacillus plantarum]MCG0894536.1 hypothetical protein [Lactiplantibacillus plantarum]MCG0900010.1 hypothetical protein [Lactiplantibacillus plantarum]VFI64825.1 hypothetical protein LAP9571_03231 [Lactiplantibacillus plantarum]VFI64874.1 hypothetical protein LAP9492_03227 [Lactiplantibacillus plantarum]
MQYTAPILGKVFSHISLVLVWSSSRKTYLPNLSIHLSCFINYGTTVQKFMYQILG